MASHIYSWIHMVYVLLIELFPQKGNGFTKPLEVNDFPLTKEFDNIIYIRIIRQAENVIVGYPGFLFCCQVLCQISHRVSFHGHHSGVIQCAGSGVGEYTNCMIHKVGSKRRILDLTLLQISCELMDDCPNHLQMAQFFCTYKGVKMEPRTRRQCSGMTA